MTYENAAAPDFSFCICVRYRYNGIQFISQVAENMRSENHVKEDRELSTRILGVLTLHTSASSCQEMDMDLHTNVIVLLSGI